MYTQTDVVHFSAISFSVEVYEKSDPWQRSGGKYVPKIVQAKTAKRQEQRDRAAAVRLAAEPVSEESVAEEWVA